MNIVMTGATSGIGAEALKHFTDSPNTKVYIGARGEGRQAPDKTMLIPLDLSSLKSVRDFADKVKQQLGTAKIDILILNAGIRATDNSQKSEEGFELTFATNHLAHYLLARLFMPIMSDGAKLILTTSDAHDPAIIPFGPKKLNIAALADTAKDSPKGMALYAATKLCNLITAYSLAENVAKERTIKIIAYNPGLTGNTSLMGKQSVLMKSVVEILRALFYAPSVFKPGFFMGTAKRSGENLAKLALGQIIIPTGKIYASLVRGRITFPKPSKLARDKNTRDLLWKESARMARLFE